MNIDIPEPLMKDYDEKQLKYEFNLIYLLYHRNKNQFHLLNWFQPFHQLLTYIKKLILVVDKHNYRRIKTNKKYETFQKLKSKRNFYHKQKFHFLALRFKNLSKFILNRLVPVCYRKFMQILSLGQFITLGFALIAMLAKIRSICASYVSSHDQLHSAINNEVMVSKASHLENNDKHNNEDMGENFELIDKNTSAVQVSSDQIGNHNNNNRTILGPAKSAGNNTNNTDIVSRNDIAVVDIKSTSISLKKKNKKKKKGKSKNYFEDIFG